MYFTILTHISIKHAIAYTANLNKNGSIFRHIIPLIIILFLVPEVIAQRPLNYNQNFASRGGAPSQNSEQDAGPDSTVYQYYLLDSPTLIQDIKDSLADISFLHHYSGWSNDQPYLHTGNLGSAAMPLVYSIPVYTHFSTGYDQYNPYQIRPENFKFYKQNRPISDLYFSQLATQENIMAGAAFSRNFKGGLSISLNYLRISQKGFYNSQKTKSTAFGLGMHYESPSQRYRMMLLFTNNAQEESHNGGVLPGANLGEAFKQTIPVLLANAETRQQERHLSVTQYYYFQQDTGKPSGFYASNHTAYQPSYFKYADKQIDSLDQIFYSGLSADSRGLRRYTTVNQLHNGFYIHGSHRSGISGKVGLLLDIFKISPDNTGSSFWRTDITAAFDGKVPVAKALLIDTKVRLGLGQNTGNVDISGNIRLLAGKAGSLDAGARFFRSEQPFRAMRLDLNLENVVTNTFSKPFGTALSATLAIPALHSHIGIEQMLVQNPIYFNEKGLPSQSETVFSLTRMMMSFSARFSSFTSENTGYLQVQSNTLYPIPPWFTSHQLYFTGKWFKKVMEVSLGLDGRLIAAYKGPQFQPLFGAYHISDTDLPLTPVVNAFFMARISSFRAKFIMENMGQFLFPDKNFSVVNHPLNPPALRFGVQWLLKD